VGLKQGALVRYGSHVGHSFSSDSLAIAQTDRLEDTLWSALRAIEESIELRKRMMARAESRHLKAVLAGLKRDTEELEQRGDALRTLLLGPARPEGQLKTSRRRRSRKQHGKKTR
jgi:two-component system chemotaxis response regulator CheB